MTMQTTAPLRAAVNERGSFHGLLGVVVLERLCELMLDHKPDEAQHLAETIAASPTSAEAVIAMAVGVIVHQEKHLRDAQRDLEAMRVNDPQLAEQLFNTLGATDDAK